MLQHLYFKVGGRPPENFRINSADVSAFDNMFPNSHLHTEGSSSGRRHRCSNSEKKFSRFPCRHRAFRKDLIAFL